PDQASPDAASREALAHDAARSEEARPAEAVIDSDARSYGFPRKNRVTRGPEIEQVRKEGKRVRTASMEVRAVASLHASGRVGIIVPKYGHSSVDRNKVKRRLRELVRVETLRVLPTLDVVVRVAPRAYERKFDELREEVRKWTRQLIAQKSGMKPISPPIEPSPGTPA
ncbi:MAG: ribonuclease P protein component, partial [Gemmatimonadaceae bacterium]